jgi:hypothetical protein
MDCSSSSAAAAVGWVGDAHTAVDTMPARAIASRSRFTLV